MSPSESTRDTAATRARDNAAAYAGRTRRPIPRVDRITPEEFEASHILPGQPVIITNAMKDWPALRDWTPAYFKEKHGTVSSRVSHDLPDTPVPSLHRWANHNRTMTMAEFIDLMSSGGRPCYIDSRAVTTYAGEEEKLRFDDLIKHRHGRALSLLWIGSSGTHSGFHCDRYNNLFGQVFGEKVVCLAAPDQSRYLYQFKDVVQKSNIDPENPDLVRFPKSRHATILDGVVRPGDVLYIPKLWWHSLRSTQASISVNHWFGDDARTAELLPMFATSGLLSWVTIGKDFVWHGLLGRPYQQRLLSEEPNGAWLYKLVAAAVKRRLGIANH